MNIEFFEQANLIAEKYNENLKSQGVVCKLSKMEIKTVVLSMILGHGTSSALLDSLLENFLDKREEKIHKNKRNKYSLLILSFHPADKKIKVENPKSYAFVIKSITRPYEGFEAKEKNFDENKILKKVEKRITKTLKKTENKSPEKICKSSFGDNLRYLFLEKYSYQKTVFGKNRDTLETVLLLTFFLIFTIILVVSLFF